MVRLALVVVVLVGCKGELNAVYCAQHREDPDCLITGVPMLDAPTPECETSAQCVGNSNGGVCDTIAKRCVECLPGGESSCAATQFCGADQRCVGCINDDDCVSGVCLGTRTCAPVDNILYAKPDGTGSTCTSAAPCTFSEAVRLLTMDRNIIKLTRVPDLDYGDPPISIDVRFPVQIIGHGVEYDPEGSGDAITATNANLQIVGLTIKDTDGSAVRCMGGVVALQDMTIRDSSGYGVMGVDCNVSIMRTDLSQLPSGAIFLDRGEHEIRNNVIHDNGNSNLETGVVRILGARGRLRFNTIVNTLSRGGGQRIGGIACTAVASGAFSVAQNIIVNYGDGSPIGGTCTVRDNFIMTDAAQVRFVSDTDFHLTAQSPPGFIRDVPSPIVSSDCSEGAGNIDDVDGQARPYNNFCDRGADEYHP